MRVLSVYFVILVFISLNPWLHPDPSLAVGNIAWDKIDHATAYCLLFLLIMRAYRFHKQLWVASFIVLLSCALAGVLFEYFQHWFTSTRMFSYQDGIANVLGAVSGMVLYWCYLFVAVNRVK